MSIYILASFFIYFSILLCIGIVSHKKQTTSAGYIMGNRSLNFWLVALSAHASDMSAWLFMALPMAIYTLGLPRVWIPIGLLIYMFLNWQLIAPRLRILTEKYNTYTLSSFFEKRFDDTSGILRVLSAFVMVIFLTHYLSAGLIAMGNLLEILFDLNYYFGVSIGLFVVVAYTFFGGFNTVALIDLIQGIFLLAVIIFVPAYAYFKIDGWNLIETTAQLNHIDLTFKPNLELLLLSLSWGLGYFGQPHIITKFMGIKHASDLNKSKWLGMSWQLLALTASVCVGLIGIGYFPDGMNNPEMVFVEMVRDLFHPFVIGFILCAVIAANLSTMDSQILVCGSMMSKDLYLPLHKTPPSDRKVLWFSKLSVIAISLVALVLSLNRSATIMNTVFYSWSGLGSAFGPLVLMSLYSKTANRYGAFAGILVGTVIAMSWQHINDLLLSYPIPMMIPGFFLSLAAIYLVSLATRQSTLEVKLN